MRRDTTNAGAFRNAANAFYASEGADDAMQGRLRPALPPIAFCALGLWLAAAVSYAAACDMHVDACSAVTAVCAVAACFVVIVVIKTKAHALAMGSLGILLGCSCTFSAAALAHESGVLACGEPYQTYRVAALEDASKSEFGSSFLATALTHEGLMYRVRMYLNEDDPLARYGDEFVTRMRLESPSASARVRMWQEGVVATASPDAMTLVPARGPLSLLLTARNDAIDAFSSLSIRDETKGALTALVCGYRTILNDSGIYDAFKLSGLAHVIAVSGSHLSIVAGIVAGVLRFAHAGRRTIVVTHVVFVVGYLVFSGVPVSAVRSALMASASVASVLAWRRSSSLNALALCVITMICLDPACAVSASFALSAASTATIVLFTGLVSSWVMQVTKHRLPRLICEPLALTLAASVGSLPLSASLFYQLPIVSVAANIVAGPLFAISCIAGFIAALTALVIPPLFFVFAMVGAFFAWLLCETALFFSALPFSCIPVSVDTASAVALTLASSALLWRLWPSFSGRTLRIVAASLLTGAAAVSILLPSSHADEIVALDVGQGDAILIRSRGRAVLVDTGNQDTRLAAALARQGVYRLDALVITHADDDHCGSLLHVAGIVEIDRVVVARDALSCSCESCTTLKANAANAVGQRAVVGVEQNDAMRVGRFTLSVVWPELYAEEGGNADSLCLLARIDCDDDGVADWSTLLVGDAEATELRQIIDEYPVTPIDVYKVGHHGSAAAITPEIALELAPSLSVVSVGENNRYGHPAPDTIDALTSAGSTIVRTDESGDIICRFTAHGIEVSTMR